jgi:tetratricopeptide (TPR) repeat protein
MRVANAIPANARDGLLEPLAKSDAANSRLRQSIFYIHERMGRRLESQGRLESALEHYRRSVALGENIADADSSNLENVSMARLGDWPTARERYQQTVEASRQLSDNKDFSRLVAAGIETATAGLARCPK